MKLVKIILSILSLALVACAPRGENKSVDEVLKLDQERYDQAASKASSLKDDVKAPLTQVKSRLDEMVNAAASAVPTKSNEIADLLSQLEGKAGYTTRPSITELVSQYRALSSKDSTGITGPQVKLLVARTYSLLASELETTKFALA